MAAETRSDFYKTVTTDGVQEKDLLTMPDLDIKRQTRYYTVTEADIYRPDLMSMRITGNINYAWIIFRFNGIMDPWNDIYPGLVLNIPNTYDISNFFNKE